MQIKGTKDFPSQSLETEDKTINQPRCQYSTKTRNMNLLQVQCSNLPAVSETIGHDPYLVIMSGSKFPCVTRPWVITLKMLATVFISFLLL